MPDEIDRAQQRQEEFLDSAISGARGDIPAGVPGECSRCGEQFGRLVGGACVPCRERYKLK